MTGPCDDGAPYKFGSVEAGDGAEYAYPNVWEQQRTTGPDRLVIAPASGQIGLMRRLTEVLPEPFGVLYVLLVPRGGGEEGRYQSPEPLSRDALGEFLDGFREFFERDARHHLWVVSLPASATLVYDSHNVLYAYGPLEEFKPVLAGQGLHEGEVRVPDPHRHNYHAEFDQAQRDVLAGRPWRRFPLAGQDQG